LNDIRSTATTSVEPLVALSANGNFEKWNFRAPLWTRFYSNGIAFTILPEGVTNSMKKSDFLHATNGVCYRFMVQNLMNGGGICLWE